MKTGRDMRALLGLLALAVIACLSHTPARAANAERLVLVPRNVIYPGDEITADALVQARVVRDQNSPPIFGENPSDVVGKIARRTLLRGELIPNSAVRERDLVLQGRSYKLIYQSEFVSIVGTGVPLQSASAGEMINVRNPDTGLIIKAKVLPDQTLAVDGQ